MKLKDATPWKESYDQPRQHIQKQRHYFANKSPSSQSYGFSTSHVWMWELDYKEIWAPRIDAFELWCWRKPLRVLWTARRFNQSILKEINPDIHWKDWCWNWNANTLATWLKKWLIRKDPDAGKDWRQEEKGTTEDEIVGWHHDSMDMNLSKLWEMVKDREAWHAAIHGVTKNWTWLSGWTTTTNIEKSKMQAFIYWSRQEQTP